MRLSAWRNLTDTEKLGASDEDAESKSRALPPEETAAAFEGSHSRNLVFSFLERIFPRAASAIVMLVLATFVAPNVVGVYAWGVLALTLFQSVTDSAVRQIAVLAIKSRSGLRFLDRYALWSSILGILFLALVLAALGLFLPEDVRHQTIFLVPLLLIPPIDAIRVRHVAYLQTHNKWSRLATAQLMAAIVSFGVSIPVLFLTKSLLASALQLVLTELWFTLQARVAAKRAGFFGVDESTRQEGTSPRIEYLHIALYSLLGWLQGQSDRVLLAGLAGTGKLGLYSFSWSLSRSAGDAVSNATANVLRPALIGHEISEVTAVRKRADQILVRAVSIAAAVIVATSLIAEFVIRRILSSDWDGAIDAVPVMSLSIIPTLLAWSLTVVLIARKRLRWAPPIKAVGVLLAVPVAFAATKSIELAAWIVVMREVIVLILMIAAAGKAAPWRSIALGAAILAAFACVILLARL
jgi:O-antigen/teichoic acid export membrane protein